MSKRIWWILIGLIFAFTLYFSVQSIHRLWCYWKLDLEIPVKIQEWSIQKVGSEYAVKVTYTYEREGQGYTGKSEMPKPYFLNGYSAQDQIKKWRQQSWKAWINQKDPSFTSIHKTFPTQKIFYTFLLLGISIYFLLMKILFYKSSKNLFQ